MRACMYCIPHAVVWYSGSGRYIANYYLYLYRDHAALSVVLVRYVLTSYQYVYNTAICTYWTMPRHPPPDIWDLAG